ncbi:hypothetical protein HYV83_05245 [Candidatus Woesearchaeota archaeon]|nr:hypothetical protein [Candidatus Woesearchaeota archaeon]
MNLQIVNPHVMKILIAARDVDSINAIAKRTGISFGWTYKWVKELARAGVFQASRMRLTLNKNSAVYKRTLAYIMEVFGNDASFYYSVLPLTGVTYCFTKTDAVFVWTKGGYQIGRSKDYYPVFVKIKEQDREIFDFYTNKLGLRVNAGAGVFFRPEFVREFKAERCENIPVDPLEATIAFMKKHFYNFQPALEMIREMYRKKLNVHYREAGVN